MPKPPAEHVLRGLNSNPDLDEPPVEAVRQQSRDHFLATEFVEVVEEYLNMRDEGDESKLAQFIQECNDLTLARLDVRVVGLVVFLLQSLMQCPVSQGDGPVESCFPHSQESGGRGRGKGTRTRVCVFRPAIVLC